MDIRFEPGATSTTINGTVRGDEYIDYVGSDAGEAFVDGRFALSAGGRR